MEFILIILLVIFLRLVLYAALKCLALVFRSNFGSLNDKDISLLQDFILLLFSILVMVHIIYNGSYLFLFKECISSFLAYVCYYLGYKILKIDFTKEMALITITTLLLYSSIFYILLKKGFIADIDNVLLQ